MYVYIQRERERRRTDADILSKLSKQERIEEKQPELQSSGDPPEGLKLVSRNQNYIHIQPVCANQTRKQTGAGMSPIQTCGRRIYNFLLPFCFFDILEMQERLAVAYDFFLKFYFKLHKSCRQELEQTFSQAFAMPSPDKTCDEGHVENQESRSDNGDDNNQNFGHVARTDLQVARFLTRRRSFA